MESLKMFSDEKLLGKCAFYSSLKDECISEKGCLHTNSVGDTLKRKTMTDYHDLYLKTDVLLLADVFEQIIKICLKSCIRSLSLF